MYKKHIDLDIDKGIDREIIAKQGDIHSRFLIIRLLENNNLIDLTGKTVRVFAIKADGTKVFNDCVISSTSAVKGIATLELTSQMLAVPGKIKVELVILQGTDKLSTVSFFITVVQSINGDDFIESSDEFGSLVVALNRLDTYDATINTLIAAWDNKFKTKYDGLNAEYAADITKAKDDIMKNTTAIETNVAAIFKKYDKDQGEATAQVAAYLNTLVYEAMEGKPTLLENMQDKVKRGYTDYSTQVKTLNSTKTFNPGTKCTFAKNFNNQVCINFSVNKGSGNNMTFSDTVLILPPELTPSENVYCCLCATRDSSNRNLCYGVITTTGNIMIYDPGSLTAFNRCDALNGITYYI